MTEAPDPLYSSKDPRVKRTRKRLDRMLALLRMGSTREASAVVAGISRPNFYRWYARSESLRDAVDKAESEAQAFAEGAVRSAMGNSWQAAAWWLERRLWQMYRRRDLVNMEVDIRKEASKIAEELGIDADQAIAEAERILAKGGRS